MSVLRQDAIGRYFIRHGQTDHNTQRVLQADDVGLNDKGRCQSELAAKKLADSIEVVLSSNLERAQAPHLFVRLPAIWQSVYLWLPIAFNGLSPFKPARSRASP